MNDLIISFFAGAGADLQLLNVENTLNYNIYYYKYINYSNINKLNLIIKSLKAYLNKDIKASFENLILKIEIEKENKKILYFENYFKPTPKNQNYIFFGVDNNGDPVLEKLDKIKSLLIGGSSGSGKSNLIHNIVLSSLLLNKNIYYFMIDLKATELTLYNKILKNSNRLIKPVATNQKQAIKTIIEFYFIIKNRFKKMMKQGKRQSTEAPIILLIDEYAQLFNTAKEKKLINNYIAKIGAIGRACNCYLILATQHPTNENLNNTIRANLQSRIALKCLNGAQSLNIINTTEAQSLNDPGEALIHIDGQQIKKFKACFVSDDLLNKIEKKNS